MFLKATVKTNVIILLYHILFDLFLKDGNHAFSHLNINAYTVVFILCHIVNIVI